MRELDAVLQGFLDAAYQDLSLEDKARLADVLELPDPELYAYLVRRHDPQDPAVAELVERIRRSAAPSA